MSDLRMAKFETMIEDIHANIEEGGPANMIFFFMSTKINTHLGLIYDYDKLNEYAKVIMQKSSITTWDKNNDFARWASKHSDLGEFKNSKARIDTAKDFIQCCRRSDDATEGYKFIFWALMILTVDKTDADAHLSLICDFARLLRISNTELEDIVYVIKTIYNEVTTEYVFKSEKVPSIFAELLNRFKTTEEAFDGE